MKIRYRRRRNDRAWMVIPGMLVLITGLVLAAGCGGEKETVEEEPGPPIRAGAVLYLAQAQFDQITGDDGKTKSVPGAARLEIWQNDGSSWDMEILEDPESNVFHKAAWFTPSAGEPGILTIGAMEAYLKIWRKQGGEWTAEALWNPVFGGKFDRLRDFEVADVTGDGNTDIVIATHDQGAVGVAVWKDGTYHPEEIYRQENTFVHEVEVGDVDGDGTIEFFTTPSKPNKLDGSIQPGAIAMYEYSDGEWTRSQVDYLETRHAKEILCVTPTGEDHPVLFSSLEGEKLGARDTEGDSTIIRLYRFEDDEITKTDIATLPGQLCRFLTMGDTDGDGGKELIASTKSDGIWKLTPPASENVRWEKELVATGTSGFEHATYLYDFTGDGKDEIYVASDDQVELRVYWHDGTDYRKKTIGKLKDRTITFNLTAHMFPAAH